MARLAGRLREIRDEHGPDSVAFYISGQLLTEDYYAAGKLVKGFLGTNNLDSNSRLCMSSAVAAYTATFGADGPPPSYAESTKPTASCCWGPTPRPAIRSCGRGSGSGRPGAPR